MSLASLTYRRPWTRSMTGPRPSIKRRFNVKQYARATLSTLNRAQAAYGVDSDAFKAEMMGSAISRTHNFISPEHISLLRDDDQSVVYTEDMLRTPPHYVFVSIDPSGS